MSPPSRVILLSLLPRAESKCDIKEGSADHEEGAVPAAKEEEAVLLNLSDSWQTLSLLYYCLPLTEPEFRDMTTVSTVDACQVECERTPGCRRVNVITTAKSSSQPMTMQCALLSFLCAGPEDLATLEDDTGEDKDNNGSSHGIVTRAASFELKEPPPSVAELEENYVRAYAGTDCESESRAMVFLHARGPEPHLYAVELRATAPDGEEVGEEGLNVRRSTASGAHCALPFTLLHRTYNDCAWSANHNASLRATVEQQRQWSCAHSGYDLESACEVSASPGQCSPPGLESESATGECAAAADWRVCDMQGAGMYIEGRDLAAGWYAFELCNMDPTASFSLRGWDKGMSGGWYGGKALLGTHGNRWSSPISVPAEMTGYCSLCQKMVLQNYGTANQCEGGRAPIETEEECMKAAAYLNQKFQHVINVVTIPRGCSLYVPGDGGLDSIAGVYFNAHETGSSTKTNYVLCHYTGPKSLPESSDCTSRYEGLSEELWMNFSGAFFANDMSTVDWEGLKQTCPDIREFAQLGCTCRDECDHNCVKLNRHAVDLCPTFGIPIHGRYDLCIPTGYTELEEPCDAGACMASGVHDPECCSAPAEASCAEGYTYTASESCTDSSKADATEQYTTCCRQVAEAGGFYYYENLGVCAGDDDPLQQSYLEDSKACWAYCQSNGRPFATFYYDYYGLCMCASACRCATETWDGGGEAPRSALMFATLDSFNGPPEECNVAPDPGLVETCAVMAETSVAPERLGFDPSMEGALRQFLHSQGYAGVMSRHVSEPSGNTCPPGSIFVRGLAYFPNATSNITWGIRDGEGMLSMVALKEPGGLTDSSKTFCLNQSMTGVFRVELLEQTFGCEPSACLAYTAYDSDCFTSDVSVMSCANPEMYTSIPDYGRSADGETDATVFNCCHGPLQEYFGHVEVVSEDGCLLGWTTHMDNAEERASNDRLENIIHLRTKGPRMTGSQLQGYDLVGYGFCRADVTGESYRVPFLKSHPVYGELASYAQAMETDAACASACDANRHCQSFSWFHRDDQHNDQSSLSQCTLYSLMPTRINGTFSARNEGTAVPRCYAKIFDGNETCASSARLLYDTHAVTESWEGCPDERRFRTRLRAGMFAGDISWTLLRRHSIPFTTLDAANEMVALLQSLPPKSSLADFVEGQSDAKNWSNVLSEMRDLPQDHVVLTIAGGSNFQDFQEQSWFGLERDELSFRASTDLCASPGTYVLRYADAAGGHNRPGGLLDRTSPDDSGWNGGTLAVAEARGCILLHLERDSSGLEQVLEARLDLGDVAGQSTSPQDLSGECCSLQSTCAWSDTWLARFFTEELFPAVDELGTAAVIYQTRVCQSTACTNEGAVRYGVNVTQPSQCCTPHSGLLELELALPYTGLEEHLPQKDEQPRERYLGIHGGNRLLAGMLLQQERYTARECDTNFHNLSGGCHHDNPSSTKPYGVDPVFLSTSDLFNPEIVPKKCCQRSTYSDGCMPPECGDFYEERELASSSSGEAGGLSRREDRNASAPYGFFEFNGRFHVWFDINLAAQPARDLVKYLEDGMYIDKDTKYVMVQLITYNAQLRFFANSELKFSFKHENGGIIGLVSSVQTINVEMYSDTAGIVRGFLEGIFTLLVIITACSESREAMAIFRETGSLKGYLKSGWNYIDVTSIALCLSTIVLWLSFIIMDVHSQPLIPL
ncbi:hypothetical protein CYMTET_24571 [Cymbomonas tetramitiformis]|uniref:Uncharacterized protein n=1 Tax=Cymbomonas tetramitiformis TaxID=36881 RepID=A0AAE0KZY3_9CHLO|nr:hypothetical protein CYMTET_24571 [Cymbomonas tetramitiformis]